MKAKVLLLSLSFCFLLQCAEKASLGQAPPAKIAVVEEDYFGRKISDPYRYMENLEDPEVQEWMKQQTDYARSVLNSIPHRQDLIDKMREFDKRKSARIYMLRITDNDRYFYLKMTPEDEMGKLYYRVGYEGEEVFLYDPETFSSDTTRKFAISSLSPSDDGSRVAFEVAPNGSESATLLIMEVASKKLYPERIDRCWFGYPSWLPGSDAFLYNRLRSADVHDREREKDSKVYLHVVGTDPSTDVEIFSRSKYPNLGIQPEEVPLVQYDKDSGYLYGLVVTVDRRLKVYHAPVSELNRDRIDWKVLFKTEDEIYDFYPTKEDLYVYTPKGAPNFKLLRTSLKHPDLSRAEVVVEEPRDATLSDFKLTKDGVYYTIAKNGVQQRLYYRGFTEETSREIPLPFAAGRIDLRTKGFKFPDVWVTISGWTSDRRRYRYLPQTGEFKPEDLSDIAEFPEYADLMAEEVMVRSHDGVMVPLSLTYKKGMVKNGKNRVLLWGYGAYGIPVNPFFSPELLLWTLEGGIVAVAHVRGGGELGESWHRGGFKGTKPNTWKDFIACAEYLIDEGYTSSQRIAINGGSAGGILIGRAMTERPDLFAVAIPEVGVMNTLRSEETPNGPVNAPEFGTVRDSAECMALIEMDAYLHLRAGTRYPATLVTAGMNDPRVTAWQPAKFAARLQAVNASDRPVLFWVDYKGGHGIGDTKSRAFEKLADVLSFALWQTGHPKYQVKL